MYFRISNKESNHHMKTLFHNSSNDLIDIYDTNYYNEKPPIQRFLEDLQNRPESVRIPLPFTKTSILKPAQFSKEYNKTFQYTDIKCGDDFMEVVRLPILTMRFKFQSLKQHKNWLKYYKDDEGCEY